MKLEAQVCSLDLAKRLWGLGIFTNAALFYWIEDRRKQPRKNGSWKARLVVKEEASRILSSSVFKYPAFTVAELGEMLPAYFTHPEYGMINLCKWKSENGWTAGYRGYDEEHLRRHGDTEAGACAAMLIYLLENKLITV
jgi:hypothetical protein